MSWIHVFVFWQSRSFVSSVFFCQLCISRSLRISEIKLSSYLIWLSPCRLDESEELFSSLGERWINSSGALRLIRFMLHFQFFAKSVVILLIFVHMLTSRIGFRPSPMQFILVIFAIRLLPFLSCPIYSLMIFRRHVLIPSCVFIMMSRVLWILWILSQVVPVFLSCCLTKNLQELIVDFCYVFQKQKNIHIRFILTLSWTFRLHRLWKRWRQIFVEIWISYYKISLKTTWQVWSLNFEFWFLNQAFLSYRNWNILVIYQLARYPQRVVHFFRCPVSRRLYDMLVRDHSVCYVSSYVILCIRYENWGSFDSLGVIYVVLSLMIILLLNVTSRIRFPPGLLTFFRSH